jgi:hypothetical protein
MGVEKFWICAMTRIDFQKQKEGLKRGKELRRS